MSAEKEETKKKKKEAQEKRKRLSLEKKQKQQEKKDEKEKCKVLVCQYLKDHYDLLFGEFDDIREGKLKRTIAWTECIEYCKSIGSHIVTKKKFDDNIKYWKDTMEKKLEDASHT